VIELLDPTRELREGAMTYASRPASLRGARVALIENTKWNSDTILRKIGERLVAEHGAAGFEIFHKRYSSVPAHEEIIERVGKEFDVMVAGIGDCGSCSSGTVLDGILLEKEGIPSASIITSVFVPTGRAMAAQWAVPGYHFLVMEHPIANLTDAELDEKVALILPEVVQLLLKEPSA
jgi:hypothetical protein